MCLGCPIPATTHPPTLLQAAKDVVLCEKPVITDDSSNLDPLLLDSLLAQVGTQAALSCPVPCCTLWEPCLHAQRHLHFSWCSAPGCTVLNPLHWPCSSPSKSSTPTEALHPPRPQIATLASVYHKPADSFVSRQRLAVQKADDLKVRRGNSAQVGSQVQAARSGVCPSLLSL